MDICEVCHKMHSLGWVAGADGNVSVKTADGGVVITPSGFSKADITPEMLVECDALGVPTGRGTPSSELHTHLRIYSDFPDVKAVIHAHPPCATAFALSKSATRALKARLRQFQPESLELNRDFVILPNHGVVTFGGDLQTAFYRMETLELRAKIILNAQILEIY